MVRDVGVDGYSTIGLKSKYNNRIQLVLLAAAAIALALVPLLFAYLQLGYQPDVAEPRADHASDVERTLDRVLVNATTGVPANYTWADRDDAVTAVRDRLAPTFESLNASALARGTAIQLSLNHSRASTVANASCPDGPGRDFGPCEADRGVVVQDRAGLTHVVATAVDVRVTGHESEVVVRSAIGR